MTTPTPTRRHQSFEPTPFIPSSSPTERSSSVSPARSLKGPTYTFTPKRIKSLPRAWERRPLTPYVPRNDVQKIWKRVPLGEIKASAGDGWRKQQGGNVNGRPVKRLKVTLQEGGKENVIQYLPSKWEDGVGVNSPKRKAVHTAGGFVAVNAAPLGEDDDNPPDEVAGEKVDVDLEGSSVTRVELVNNGSERIEMAGADGEVLPPEEPGEDRLSRDVLDSVDSSTRSEEKDHTATLNSEETAEIEESAVTSIALDETLDPARQTQECEADSLSNTSQTANQIFSLSTDHDDTAYLHDFLTRARAQKAAKQQAEATSPDQEASPVHDMDTKGPDERTSSNTPTTCHVENIQESTVPTSNTCDGTPTLQADQDTEPNATSPRRSSRLTTRLPRPQKPLTTVPSNISLKRLNGTEFIATQRETQSLAMTTRANTKRNKADAINVQLKLIQLAAEQRAQAGQVRPPQQVQKQDGAAERKKRKRTKVVSWDNTIARFEDGEEVSNSSLNLMEDDTEAQGQNLCVASTEDTSGPGRSEIAENRDQTEQHVEESRENDEFPRDEKKQVTRKVRRLRKMNVGTVNGTPAPKRRASLGIPVPTGAASALLSNVMGESTEREMAGFLEEAAKQTSIVPMGRGERGTMMNASTKPRILRRRT
ncbi:hypothetical protein H2204_010832 [Knufia peltigerae]|uniref:Uncharacterized protein n=1 Tax=Knufia peltigerae TaxID=1002370 RepID=A0AA38XVD5_9EURO|nr:hypothetical protein H2204_010832 [Knufia peltigerae]